MNLHQIAIGLVSAINPTIPAQLQQNVGYQTAADGTRIPNYAGSYITSVQVQAASQGDLQKLDRMNIQGVSTTCYMNGAASGAVRVMGKGGDLLTFVDPKSPSFGPQTWLVAAVLEQWPDWVKLALIMQNGS